MLLSTPRVLQHYAEDRERPQFPVSVAVAVNSLDFLNTNCINCLFIAFGFVGVIITTSPTPCCVDVYLIVQSRFSLT